MTTVTLHLTFEFPDQLTDAGVERLAHEDLPRMNTTDLESEGFRARMALCFGRGMAPWQRDWVRERLLACRREIRRRNR